MTALRYENLLGVPSYHHVPLFAQMVRRAFDDFAPEVVALEAVPGLEPAFARALACWPTPIVVDLAWCGVPMIPGDSVVEAYRLATARNVPVRCVDLPARRTRRRPWVPVPGAEVAAQVDLASMIEAVDAIQRDAGPVLALDLAREATMARALRALMGAHTRVLWVGGMGHWTRLVRRLEANDFDAPAVELETSPPPAPYRMTGPALFELTGRTPYEVARYAVDPERFELSDTLRSLAVESCERAADDDDREFEADDEETHSPADLTRMLTYARNLAAVAGVHALPCFATLLRSAHACVGERYAARLFLRAFDEPAPSAKAAKLPVMDFVPDPSGDEFRSEDGRHELKPYWTVEWSSYRLRWSIEQAKRIASGRQRFHLGDDEDDDGDEKDREVWTVLSSYEKQYRAYVDGLLRIASQKLTHESMSAKFASGLGDGIDVKETVRRWRDDDVYVRSLHDAGLSVTNLVIDYSSRVEGSDIHLCQGPDRDEHGWIDPSWKVVGSVSRTGDRTVLQRQPILVQRNERYLSFVTTDLGTSARSRHERSMYGEVIKKLLALRGSDDVLDAWMNIFCHFCRGKPLAYFSHYRPSRRLHGIAHRHGVRLFHVPISEVPERARRAQSQFYFLNMTEPQWKRFRRLRAEDQESFVRSGE